VVEVLSLKAASESDPDVILTGSLLTLARMAGPMDESAGEVAVREGALDITGDAYTAQTFRKLLGYAKPDFEEELSYVIGDTAAHSTSKLAKNVIGWARDARATLGSNIREFLQEESRDVPSRYEVERFAAQVYSLRDDVARLEARIKRLAERT